MLPPSDCPWCGEWTNYEVLRSHYICPRCKNPVADCCDGEQEDMWDDLSNKAGA